MSDEHAPLGDGVVRRTRPPGRRSFRPKTHIVTDLHWHLGRVAFSLRPSTPRNQGPQMRDVDQIRALTTCAPADARATHPPWASHKRLFRPTSCRDQQSTPPDVPTFCRRARLSSTPRKGSEGAKGAGTSLEPLWSQRSQRAGWERVQTGREADAARGGRRSGSSRGLAFTSWGAGGAKGVRGCVASASRPLRGGTIRACPRSDEQIWHSTTPRRPRPASMLIDSKRDGSLDDADDVGEGRGGCRFTADGGSLTISRPTVTDPRILARLPSSVSSVKALMKGTASIRRTMCVRMSACGASLLSQCVPLSMVETSSGGLEGLGVQRPAGRLGAPCR